MKVFDKSGKLQKDDVKLLEELTIVSTLEIVNEIDFEGAYHSQDNEDIYVYVLLACGKKCERCWKISNDVDECGVCPRCKNVLKNF